MRRISPPLLLCLGAGALLTGCGQASDSREAAAGPPSPTPAAAQAAAPSLWAVETLGRDQAAASTVLVCTDASIRAVFARSLPSVQGKPCRLIDQPVIGPGRFSAWCRAEGAELDGHAHAKGDLTRDFTAETAIMARDGVDREFAQTSRFRHAGACPSDWTVADSAPPGARQVVNALSGRSWTASAPAPQPAAGG